MTPAELAKKSMAVSLYRAGFLPKEKLILILTDHHCDLPVREEQDKFNYGDVFTCPACGKRWSLTVDEDGECNAYWDEEI